MPWAPELFSAVALEKLEEKRRRKLYTVPYFDGLMLGETSALVDSFAGEPELHHPLRGRVKGVAAFERFVAETREWLDRLDVSIGDVETVGYLRGELRSSRR